MHHEEHTIPPKVLKSLEDKAKKAAAKNTTTMVEAKKRKGAGILKMISKRQRTSAACAAASASVGEEVAENVGGGSSSMSTSMEGEHFATSADLGGDNLISATLQGMVVFLLLKPPHMAPMPRVLGNE